MEEVCERENCLQALKRVKSNKGSPGVDGMKVEELSGHLREHWPAIREQLLNGTYKPQPVKRVERPKPDGGMRQLGIPTVLDRMVQQAVMQVLQSRWDAEFSEHSHGFRPGRSAHQAVAKAQQYIAEGRRWVDCILRVSANNDNDRETLFVAIQALSHLSEFDDQLVAKIREQLQQVAEEEK